MYHQAQKGFRGIFIGMTKHKKVYFVYVPSTRKIISSYDVAFDKSFSSALAYTSQHYSEAMDMRTSGIYITYDTYSKQQTSDIITFTQFEEGNLLSITCNDAKSSDKADDDSIMPPLH